MEQSTWSNLASNNNGLRPFDTVKILHTGELDVQDSNCHHHRDHMASALTTFRSISKTDAADEEQNLTAAGCGG